MCAGSENRVRRSIVIRAEFLSSNDILVPTQARHVSTFAEISEGLLAVWLGGTAEGYPDVSIYVSALRGGKGEKPRKVAAPEEPGKWNVYPEYSGERMKPWEKALTGS